MKILLLLLMLAALTLKGVPMPVPEEDLATKDIINEEVAYLQCAKVISHWTTAESGYEPLKLTVAIRYKNPRVDKHVYDIQIYKAQDKRMIHYFIDNKRQFTIKEADYPLLYKKILEVLDVRDAKIKAAMAKKQKAAGRKEETSK